MSENNLKKPFTIRDVLVSDIDAFHNKRGEIGLSGAGYFHSLLHGKDVKPSSDLITNDEVRSTNNEELINLQIKFEELANENKRLTGNLNEALFDRDKFEGLFNDLKETQLKLSPLEFIVSPDIETAKKINRAIAQDRKNGLLKNVPVKNYLQNFTMKCLKYTIKNEY